MIATVILLLGSCGSASRTIKVEPSIDRILVRVVIGGVRDVAYRRLGNVPSLQVAGKDQSNRAWKMPEVSLCIDGTEQTCVLVWENAMQGLRRLAGSVGRNADRPVLDMRALCIDARQRAGSDGGFFLGIERAWQSASPRLYLDGRQVRGIFAWLAAADRVAGYAIHEGQAGGEGIQRGSVEYAYRLRVRGFDIRRATRIEDGRVSLLTDVYGAIGPRGELHHVRLVLCARETPMGITVITGVATGDSTIGSRCRIVNRIASRVISEELAKALRTIDTGGRRLYRDGDLHGIAERAIERLLQ